MTDSRIPTETPDAFGDYKVQSYIGHGSYGDVFRVFREGDVECALKILRKDAIPEAVGRFENEIWALERLDHDAIPKLIDQGTFDGRRYFVMSLARGGSLRALHHEQLKTRGAAAEMKVVAIMEVVLDAVAHMHSRNILHRDIKDDNILVTDSLDQISLVDLGFCRGQGQPVTGLTVWNAGAMHYSPPSKLRNPSIALETHDVFAIGVVAYLLLTNQYPWEVDPLDPGKLAGQMLLASPTPIHEINSLVDREVSLFIEKLLTIDDDDRPNAQMAKDELSDLRSALNIKKRGPILSIARLPNYPRVVRDPLHKDIRFTDYEWTIVNTPEFQRLRWMKQLTFSNIVYPGAEHTRMNHAFGTVFVVDKIMRSIEDIEGIRIDAEKRLLARCLALVHDVTHIAYGHTLEDELGFFSPHDSNYDRFFRLFESDSSVIGKVLKSTSFGRQTLLHLNPRTKDERYQDISDLIEGSTGADVLDYIDRDSLFCGLDHTIDSALFRRFRLTSEKQNSPTNQHLISRVYGSHGIRLDAVFALESVLVQRFALFLKVYTHPAKIAAGAMLGKALSEAISTRRNTVFEESRIELMSDVELLLRLRESRRHLCASLANRLIQRSLYRTAYRSRALKNGPIDMTAYKDRQERFQDPDPLHTPEGRKQVEGKLAAKSGLKIDDVIVYISPKAPGLQKVEQHVEAPQGGPTILDDVGQYREIVSKHLKLWTIYVFVSESVNQAGLKKLSAAAQDYFKLDNELDEDRRQGVLFDSPLTL